MRSDGIPRLLPLISPVSSQTQMQVFKPSALNLDLAFVLRTRRRSQHGAHVGVSLQLLGKTMARLPLLNASLFRLLVQLLYDAVLCLWLLSFNESALEALKPTRAIRALSDVARTSSKEKVCRESSEPGCSTEGGES